MEQTTQWIAGVDEAGRGPLAGPVYAAAVILDPKRPILGLKDSKKLNEKQRQKLFIEIKTHAKAYAVARAEVAEIDEINILQATFCAMQRAVKALNLIPNKVIIDGNQIPKLSLPTEALINGDALEPMISAASILAKVSRDQEMIRLNDQYPQYQFAQHKGYGTKAHRQAIIKHGPCPIHRRSFLKNLPQWGVR